MAVGIRELAEAAPDGRRAVLAPWLCDGLKEDGGRCNRVLMELDWTRPSFIRKICERCRHVNLFVEVYRPA